MSHNSFLVFFVSFTKIILLSVCILVASVPGIMLLWIHVLFLCGLIWNTHAPSDLLLDAESYIYVCNLEQQTSTQLLSEYLHMIIPLVSQISHIPNWTYYLLLNLLISLYSLSWWMMWRCTNYPRENTDGNPEPHSTKSRGSPSHFDSTFLILFHFHCHCLPAAHIINNTLIITMIFSEQELYLENFTCIISFKFHDNLMV